MLHLIIAEALGTFILTFIGGAAILGNTGIVGIALAHGLALMVAIYALGHISGCHANPAVSVSLWLTKNLETNKLPVYVLSQCFGAVLAALAIIAVYHPYGNVGLPEFASGVTRARGVITEGLLTFILVLAVYAMTVDKRATKGFHGLVIGMVLTLDILAGGAITGASMNPARSFGPALVSGVWTNHLVYWAGPITGGVLAALLYKYLLGESKK